MLSKALIGKNPQCPPINAAVVRMREVNDFLDAVTKCCCLRRHPDQGPLPNAAGGWRHVVRCPDLKGTDKYAFRHRLPFRDVRKRLAQLSTSVFVLLSTKRAKPMSQTCQEDWQVDAILLSDGLQSITCHEEEGVKRDIATVHPKHPDSTKPIPNRGTKIHSSGWPLSRLSSQTKPTSLVLKHVWV